MVVFALRVMVDKMIKPGVGSVLFLIAGFFVAHCIELMFCNSALVEPPYTVCNDSCEL